MKDPYAHQVRVLFYIYVHEDIQYRHVCMLIMDTLANAHRQACKYKISISSHHTHSHVEAAITVIYPNSNTHTVVLYVH